MDKNIACCGLNCAECPTYLATQNNDDGKREKVAGQWSKQFGMKLTAQDINCDGCLSGSSRLFGHCRNCQIRACCETKGIDNCAACDDYPCEGLNALFAFIPHARASLEAIRNQSV